MKPRWDNHVFYTTAGQAVHVYTDGDGTHREYYTMPADKILGR